MFEKKYTPPTNKAANRIIVPLLMWGGGIVIVVGTIVGLIVWGSMKVFGG